MFYAVAWDWRNQGFDLRIYTEAGREIFGDVPVEAPSWEAVPDIANKRLQRAGYRMAEGSEWVDGGGQCWAVAVESITEASSRPIVPVNPF